MNNEKLIDLIHKSFEDILEDSDRTDTEETEYEKAKKWQQQLDCKKGEMMKAASLEDDDDDDDSGKRKSWRDRVKVNNWNFLNRDDDDDEESDEIDDTFEYSDMFEEDDDITKYSD